MIVSASYRTDIPAFYTDWFNNCYTVGKVSVRNPYGGKPYQVSLRPDDVTGFVFWTRNISPFASVLERIDRDQVPFMIQFTITGYPGVLETSVIDVTRAIEQISQIEGAFGPNRVVWRYDPVLITDLTPPDWHLDNITQIAGRLEGYVDECVLSFAAIYRKTRTNLDRVSQASGLSWMDPDLKDKQALLAEFGRILSEHGMTPRICSQPELESPALEGAACIDIERLSRISGAPLKARIKGNREGCLCAESRDIGAYDTCPHGCAYCYAVRNRDLAKRKYRDHDPEADML